ncbi:hypothetical protein [Thermospira aquatica]|uniref:Uncharacterized protein n=1 Tax=Thermospira aquatica TaxID=2828656 RepID=A0AAX3BBT5_9SPIR|nr:hypothetical protein [Thermospira aquatica]URA09555.1 hypothetical protein KDW03_08660 [Thermospira aquatica]
MVKNEGIAVQINIQLRGPYYGRTTTKSTKREKTDRTMGSGRLPQQVK